MLEFERSYDKRKKINLTPLIDVVFQLVIFFMLSSSFVQTSLLGLSFSSAAASAAVGDDKSILVRVVDNRRVELNDKMFTFREFPLKLARLAANSPDYSIVVVAEKEVSVQGLVTVMDFINLAGIKNVTLAQPQN